jgi:long-chain acyl-CoA synthetase
VLVPLDLASNPDYVGRVVAQTEPKLALLSGETLASWQSAVPSVKIEDFEALPRADGDLPPVDVAPNDLAVVMFTSGTTGTPKGVMLTHWNIVFDAEAADKYVPPTPKFRIVSLLPLSHMLEQSVGLLMAMKRRASIFYIPNRLPSTIFSALKEHGATTMVLAPRALQLFMSAIEQEVKKQGKEKLWERMQAVGEHMPEAVRRMMFRSVHQRLGGMVEFLVSGGAPIDAGPHRTGVRRDRVRPHYQRDHTRRARRADGREAHPRR